MIRAWWIGAVLAVGVLSRPIGAEEKTAIGDTIDIFVVDSNSEPIPEATVAISPVGGTIAADAVLRGSFLDKGEYRTRVNADVGGRLAVRLPKDGLKRVDVYIEQPGYAPYWALFSAAALKDPDQLSITAELDPGWTVGGVLVDPAGRPVVGAKVNPSIRFKNHPGQAGQLYVGAEMTTDAVGRWSWGCVPDTMDVVTVSIEHPQFMTTAPELERTDYELVAGAVPSKTIALERGLRVSGRVTDEAGSPIQGAVVFTQFVNDDRSATTDADGQYRMIGCRPDKVRVVVRAKGKALDMQEVEVASEMKPVDFVMKPGGTIRLRVVDAAGKPVPKARVFFQEWRGPIGYFEFNHVNDYANDDGVWVWDEAPPDEIRADICPPEGSQMSRQSLISGHEEYVFRTAAPLRISGSVIDADTGEPVAKFRVIPGVQWGGRPTAFWERDASSEFSAASHGRYEIHRNRNDQGLQFVRIEAAGYQAAVSRPILADEGSVTVDFKMGRGQDVASQILTPAGTPAAKADVVLGIAGSQTMIVNGEFSAQTYADQQRADSEGRFHFPQPDGKFQLTVLHPTGFARIKLNAGDTAPETIPLRAWARVEGTYRIGAEAQAGVTLELQPLDVIDPFDRGGPHFTASSHARTGKDGTFLFERAFPGNARIGRRIIMMVDTGATEVTSAKLDSVELVAGATTHLDLGGDGRTVAGRFIPPPGFAKAPDWRFGMALLEVNLAAPPLPIPAAVRGNPQALGAWRKEWLASDAGKTWQAISMQNAARQMSAPQYRATLERDGSFRIDDVEPGEYRLMMFHDDHFGGHIRNRLVTVPAAASDEADGEVVDLGVIELESR